MSRLATWLTTLLHFDVRFYGRSLTLMSFAQVSTVVRGVATTFFMARWLPRDTLGEFRYILALFGVAGIFSLTGLNAGVIRGVAKGDYAVARAALKRIAAISPLGSLFLLIAAFERYAHGEMPVAIGLVISAFAFPAYSLCGMYGVIMTGKEQVRRLVTYTIANNLLFAACFFIVILNTKLLIPVLVAYFGFDVLFRGILTLREVRALPRTGAVGEHLRLGLHLSAIGVFQTIAAQLDQILLQRFFGYGTLANFSVATLIPEQIKDFVNSVSGFMLRRFSRHERTDAIVAETRRHFRTMLGMSAACVAGYAVLAPIVIPWLFPQYGNEVLPSIVYSIGLLGMASVVGVNFFQAHNQIRTLWRFYVINTVLQLGTNVLLIPWFGAWGAIASKTVTRLACVPLSYPTRGREGAAGTPRPSAPPPVTNPVA